MLSANATSIPNASFESPFLLVSGGEAAAQISFRPAGSESAATGACGISLPSPFARWRSSARFVRSPFSFLRILPLAAPAVVIVQGRPPAAGRSRMVLRSQVDSGLARDGVLQNVRILQHLLDDLHEHLPDAQFGLRRGLQEQHPLRPSPSVRLLLRHGPLRFLVALVPHQHLDDVLAVPWAVHLDLAQPLGQVLERVGPRDVVHQDAGVSSAVVAASQGPEPLLPRGVPDRQLDPLPLHLDVLDLEVDPDRRLDVLVEAVVREAQQYRRLPRRKKIVEN